MTVLVCTDFSAAAAAGEREAPRRFPDATLIVFHAVDRGLVLRVAGLTGLDAAKLEQDMTEYADARLNEIALRLGSQGVRARAELVAGDPVDAALAAASRHRVHAIVVGVAAPAGGAAFRAGLVRRARTPVLIIPA